MLMTWSTSSSLATAMVYYEALVSSPAVLDDNSIFCSGGDFRFLMGGTSSKNALQITAHDKAILDLKLELVIAKEVEVAKHHLKNNDKKRAMLALKKKKFQESLLEKTDAQLFTLEQMTQTIEYSLIEKDIVNGLKKGNDVLAQIHKEMSVEAVEKLMDDTADAIAYQNEIDQLLSGSLSKDDEEEAEAELEELLRLELEAAPKVPKTTLGEGEAEADGIEFPEVPTTEPSAAEPAQSTPQKGKAKAKAQVLAA
ncbi:Vacuolar protein sorting-associated protein 20 [Phlyctochytrium bullatum]|nr:Vacuolar protein sorting-associated protein 20 [Phlyctochytrium bullatum]